MTLSIWFCEKQLFIYHIIKDGSKQCGHPRVVGENNKFSYNHHFCEHYVGNVIP
jgi:hypothetical protein